MGTVVDLGPMPKPSAKRDMNLEVVSVRSLAVEVERKEGQKEVLVTDMCHQLSAKPCQKHARALNKQVMKMVPRLPNQLLNGVVSQHPKKAQQI